MDVDNICRRPSFGGHVIACRRGGEEGGGDERVTVRVGRGKTREHYYERCAFGEEKEMMRLSRERESHRRCPHMDITPESLRHRPAAAAADPPASL
jgi:hypothetical protein